MSPSRARRDPSYQSSEPAPEIQAPPCSHTEHRPRLAVGRRRADGQRQAIFVVGSGEIPHRHAKARRQLRRDRSMPRRVAQPGPGANGRGRRKAQFSDRRCGEGHAAERRDTVRKTPRRSPSAVWATGSSITPWASWSRPDMRIQTGAAKPQKIGFSSSPCGRGSFRQGFGRFVLQLFHLLDARQHLHRLRQPRRDVEAARQRDLHTLRAVRGAAPGSRVPCRFPRVPADRGCAAPPRSPAARCGSPHPRRPPPGRVKRHPAR